MINEINQKEISRICPNKLVPCVYKYRHSEDCVQSGCPNHTATFTYHSVTDHYSIELGDGKSIVLDSEQMDMLHDWIERLKA